MDKIYNIDYIKQISEGELKVLLDDIELLYDKNDTDDVDTDECPSCGEKNDIRQDFSKGITVCENCGQVLDNVIDSNPEWKNYDEDNNTRCSMPTNKLLPQSSLGTTISGGTYKNRIKILHNWNAIPYKERSLHTVFKEIQDKCSRAKIMKCIEDDAKIMYKIINDSRHISGKNKGKYIIIRGANRKSLIAACIFFACKKKDMTRSPKEISDLFGLKQTELSRGCKSFMRLIKRKVEVEVKMSMPEHFVMRFCNELQIQKKYIDITLDIARNIYKLNIATDHTPLSIAIGSILLMAENYGLVSITKKILADKFDISEVTISKTCKKIWEYKDIILNNEIVVKIVKDHINKMVNLTIPQHIIERMKKFGIKPPSKNHIAENKSVVLPIGKNIADGNISDNIDLDISVNISNINKQYDREYADIRSNMYTTELKYKNICFAFFDK